MLGLIKCLIKSLSEVSFYPKQTQQTRSETKFITYTKPSLYF